MEAKLHGKLWFDVLKILVGSSLVAISFRYLTFPNSIVSGGVTGIAQIVNLLTGLPVRVTVSTDDLYEPVMMLSEQIGTAAHQVLEKTPPELAGDIYRNGVMLTGGGAQLHGLTEYLSQELKVEVTVSPDPVNCVALGTAQSLSIGDKLETGFTDATPRIGRR